MRKPYALRWTDLYNYIQTRTLQSVYRVIPKPTPTHTYTHTVRSIYRYRQNAITINSVVYIWRLLYAFGIQCFMPNYCGRSNLCVVVVYPNPNLRIRAIPFRAWRVLKPEPISAIIHMCIFVFNGITCPQPPDIQRKRKREREKLYLLAILYPILSCFNMRRSICVNIVCSSVNKTILISRIKCNSSSLRFGEFRVIKRA